MPTMDKRQIIDTNFDTAKADMKTTDFIDNDIALYDDASKIQLPKEPRRTTFILWVCAQRAPRAIQSTPRKSQ